MCHYIHTLSKFAIYKGSSIRKLGRRQREEGARTRHVCQSAKCLCACLSLLLLLVFLGFPLLSSEQDEGGGERRSRGGRENVRIRTLRTHRGKRSVN